MAELTRIPKYLKKFVQLHTLRVLRALRGSYHLSASDIVIYSTTKAW